MNFLIILAENVGITVDRSREKRTNRFYSQMTNASLARLIYILNRYSKHESLLPGLLMYTGTVSDEKKNI